MASWVLTRNPNFQCWSAMCCGSDLCSDPARLKGAPWPISNSSLSGGGSQTLTPRAGKAPASPRVTIGRSTLEAGSFGGR